MIIDEVSYEIIRMCASSRRVSIIVVGLYISPKRSNVATCLVVVIDRIICELKPNTGFLATS